MFRGNGNFSSAVSVHIRIIIACSSRKLHEGFDKQNCTKLKPKENISEKIPVQDNCMSSAREEPSYETVKNTPKDRSQGQCEV